MGRNEVASAAAAAPILDGCDHDGDADRPNKDRGRCQDLVQVERAAPAAAPELDEGVVFTGANTAAAAVAGSAPRPVFATTTTGFAGGLVSFRTSSWMAAEITIWSSCDQENSCTISAATLSAESLVQSKRKDTVLHTPPSALIFSFM